MNTTAIARRLRRERTDEEKELWRALKAGRFSGFKFRRQHPRGKYFLDFYCPTARLSVELDGFQHGLRSTSSGTRNGPNISRQRASKNYGFGIISGTRTGKGCCWESGRRFIAGQVT